SPMARRSGGGMAGVQYHVCLSGLGGSGGAKRFGFAGCVATALPQGYGRANGRHYPAAIVASAASCPRTGYENHPRTVPESGQKVRCLVWKKSGNPERQSESLATQ